MPPKKGYKYAFRAPQNRRHPTDELAARQAREANRERRARKAQFAEASAAVALYRAEKAKRGVSSGSGDATNG